MCGIVGINHHEEAANLAYLCLYAQQHRGQESAGIVTSDKGKFHLHRQMGLVADIFSADVLAQLPGDHAIGHVRYSTTGDPLIENAQPFVVNTLQGWISLVHNGNLTNALHLRRQMEADGAIFQSTIDSEVIMHLIARSRERDTVLRIADALRQVQGAYSLIFMAGNRLIAARDPHGWRPLVIGKLDKAHVVASETCALDLIGAQLVREVEPGEIVVFENGGFRSEKLLQPSAKKAHCIFEYVYFARPDSQVYGRDVYPIRKGFGQQLAMEHPVDADVVIPVPDSGVPAAIGYSEQSGIPYQMGLIRNHYVGRTFIEPKNEIRHFGVRVKLNPVREVLAGKRVVVVDDSIVRGTTSMKIVKMLRQAGASEVHMRVSSPPTSWPCYYGINTPTREELISARHSVEQIRDYITADSLGYLSHEGLYHFAKQEKGEWYCDACFTGYYPVPVIDAPRIMDEARDLGLSPK